MSRLSMDDILKEIEEVAKTGEGADKFRALKFLASVDNSQFFLPPPLTDVEVEDRGVRIFRTMGPDICRIIYARAFSGAMVDLPVNITGAHLTSDELAVIDKCTDLKVLNRYFPEFRKVGQPRGYPKGRGEAARMLWCRARAKAFTIFRKQKEAGIRDVSEFDSENQVQPSESPGAVGLAGGTGPDEALL